MWSWMLATLIYLMLQTCVSCTNIKDKTADVKEACGSYKVGSSSYSEETLNAWKNGEKTPLVELGGTAALHTSVTDLRSNTHKCGASLISNRYLLTAAHCVAGDEKTHSISLGREDLDVNPTPGPDTDIYTIVNYTIHPDYQPERNAYNNIAILKTDRPVRYSDKIWPFCLPERNQVFEGFVQIAGWGNVDETSKPSNIHTAFVSIEDKYRCESSWLKHATDLYYNITQFDYPQGLTDQILCAGRGGVDACIGDDGGPMAHTNNKGKEILIGIIAERINCPEYPITPGFYTNVAYYTDWIYDTTGLLDPSQPSLDDQVDVHVGDDGVTGGGSTNASSAGIEGALPDTGSEVATNSSSAGIEGTSPDTGSEVATNSSSAGIEGTSPDTGPEVATNSSSAGIESTPPDTGSEVATNSSSAEIEGTSPDTGSEVASSSPSSVNSVGGSADGTGFEAEFTTSSQFPWILDNVIP